MKRLIIMLLVLSIAFCGVLVAPAPATAAADIAVAVGSGEVAISYVALGALLGVGAVIVWLVVTHDPAPQ